MKSREIRAPLKYLPHPLLARRKSVRDAVDAIMRGERWRDVLSRFTPEEQLLLLVYYVKKRHPLIDEHSFGCDLFDAANKLIPAVVAPKLTSPLADSLTGWKLDLGQKVWTNWWDPSVRRAHVASMEAAKAVGVMTSRYGPHLFTAHDIVSSSDEIRRTFGALTVGAGRLPTGAVLHVPGYVQTSRNVRRIASVGAFHAMEGSVRAAQELREMYPDRGIGERLVVDGTWIPAWTPQKSAKRNGAVDPEIEAHYRERTPDAGHRAIRVGVPPWMGKREASAARWKSVRGYLLVIISDLMTGIPLVGMIGDASKLHETHAIYELLPMLYALWSDCPARFLVGDARWDENDIHKYALTRYGVGVVSHRSPSHSRNHVKLEGDRFHPQIAMITGDGQAICRAHGALLPFSGSVIPTRDGLNPGDPTDAAKFRSRWTCDQGCGRVSVATRHGWTAMPVLPLNPNGRPKLHAERIALLARRNVAESVFASLKGTLGHGTSGPYRTRMLDKDAIHGLIWVSLFTRTLITLAAERQKQVR